MLEKTNIDIPTIEEFHPLVEHERILSTDDGDVYATTLTRSDGTKLGLIPVIAGLDRAERYGSALTAAHIATDLLPAHGSTYTSNERTFAQDVLHMPSVRISHPNLGTLKAEERQLEAYFFEPTPTTLLDVMAMAGHDSSPLRELRRASAHGDENNTTKALEVLCDIGVAESKRATDPNRFPLTAPRQALANAFRFHAEFGSILDDLCSNGLESPLLQTMVRKIESGVRSDIIELVAQGSEDSRSLVREAWQESVAVAKTHNDEGDGAYIEVHRIGNQDIPIIAVEGTAWNERNSALGFVNEDSDHTLADIYTDRLIELRSAHATGEFRDSRERELLEVACSHPHAALAEALGLSYHTIVARGRWHGNDELSIDVRSTQIQHQSPSQLDRLYREMKQLGLNAVFADRRQQSIDVTSLSRVDSHLIIHEIPVTELAASTDDLVDDYLAGVVTSIDVQEKDLHPTVTQGQESSTSPITLNLSSAEAPLKRHDALYNAYGLDTFGYRPVQWGGEIMQVGIRYSLDAADESNSANIFFNGEATTNSASLEAALVRSITDQLFARNGYNVNVTVAQAGQQPKFYSFKARDLLTTRT